MKSPGLSRAFIALLLGLAAQPVTASKAPEPAKFTYDAAKGHILIRVGPVKKAASKSFPLILVRLDTDGKPLWHFGDGLADSKKNLDVVFVWSSKHWGFDGDSNLYLVPVNPGRWVIGAANNTNFSLGSYGFEVPAGRVTYVGKVLIGPEDGKSEVPEIRSSVLSQDLLEFGTLMNIVMSDTFVLRRPAGDEVFPEKIAALGVVNADIANDVRFDNFSKSLVGRAADLPPKLILPTPVSEASVSAGAEAAP